MQDIVDAAKRAANVVAERAAWEADRLRRLTARQKEIDLAKRERATLLEQVARTMLDLESRGQLTQEPLLALSRRLRELDQEIANSSNAVQSVRAESYRAGAPGAAGGALYQPHGPAAPHWPWRSDPADPGDRATGVRPPSFGYHAA